MPENKRKRKKQPVLRAPTAKERERSLVARRMRYGPPPVLGIMPMGSPARAIAGRAAELAKLAPTEQLAQQFPNIVGAIRHYLQRFPRLAAAAANRIAIAKPPYPGVQGAAIQRGPKFADILIDPSVEKAGARGALKIVGEELAHAAQMIRRPVTGGKEYVEAEKAFGALNPFEIRAKTAGLAQSLMRLKPSKAANRRAIQRVAKEQVLRDAKRLATKEP